VTYRFGEFAELLGYDLAPAPTTSPATFYPGDRVVVTLYYRSRGVTGQNYVRFLQLLDPAFSPAAQQDAIPRSGGNPTWSWQPGEVVIDHAELRIADGAAPGVYTLYTGFYPAEDPNARVEVLDAAQNAAPNRWAAIGELVIAARP
jgi:hypothetical protein